MTSEHNKGALKLGDQLSVELADGHTLQILVYADYLFVKSNVDDIDVKPHASYGIKIKRVPRKYGN